MGTVTPERAQRLPVMCLLALIVGALAGLGAWLFRTLIGGLHNAFFLGRWQIAYDANAHTAGNPWGIGIVFIPVIGSLLVVWLVQTFAREAKGHGVPEVIDAIHYNRGNIRPIVAVIKSLASAICIGSGGSVGREGPIIQIGSALGSALGQLVRVPTRQRITLVAAGAAAGIAATFNAPLGGILFAIELLLISVNVRNLLPVALATTISTYIGRALLGTHPSFDFAPLRVTEFHLESPWMLLLFIPFGVLMGLGSVLFIKGIYWTEDRFEMLPGNAYIRHAAGMLIVGIMLYILWRWTGQYNIEGIGYATIMDVLTGVLANPAMLLLLCALKLLATSLTLGSGGSGGIFSPALFMGATGGSAIALAAQHWLPGVEIDPLTFALAGMAASVGASTGAMITAAVMLREMTDDNNVVMPVIVTTIVACGIRKFICPDSIYTLKLVRRGHLVPEGLQSALDDARNVSHVMSTDYRVVDLSVGDGQLGMHVTVFARDGRIVRVVDPMAPSDRPSEPPAETDLKLVIVNPETPLVDVMRQMRGTGVTCALVSTAPESRDIYSLVGVVTLRELSLYRAELAELFS